MRPEPLDAMSNLCPALMLAGPRDRRTALESATRYREAAGGGRSAP
jgi:hypothetical protein